MNYTIRTNNTDLPRMSLMSLQLVEASFILSILIPILAIVLVGITVAVSGPVLMKVHKKRKEKLKQKLLFKPALNLTSCPVSEVDLVSEVNFMSGVRSQVQGTSR